MVLDECPPWPCEYDYAARSLEMTHRWAARCKAISQTGFRKLERKDETSPQSEIPNPKSQMVFGIVQGGTFEDLRRTSAQTLAAMDFDGYAIGGVSVGEPEPEMMSAVEWSEPHLPANKPRYAMGLGTPPQLLELVARGVDMFDCVLPTRLARNGTAFTAQGTLNLKNAEFTLQKGPIEEGCGCPACRDFTRGYIRHLVKSEEILGLRLLTLHNLHFYLDLMRRVRAAIEEGTFPALRAKFVAGYKTRGETSSSLSAG
jgi:queuine tRNA-ribosyltransferase